MLQKLAFLSEVKLDANAGKPERKARAKKSSNPEEADLRLFKNGSIYPSAKLVERFDLEYRSKSYTETGEVVEPEFKGNGFDVCDSKEFLAFKVSQRVLTISPVNRDMDRINIFGSVTCFTPAEEEKGDGKAGVPKASVMNQGSSTFGKELLKSLEEVYGVIPNAQGYIDLQLIGKDEENNGWTFEGPVFIPKRVVRGDKEGQLTVTRRENSTHWVLYPVMETAGKVGDVIVAEEEEDEMDSVPQQEG